MPADIPNTSLVQPCVPLITCNMGHLLQVLVRKDAWVLHLPVFASESDFSKPISQKGGNGNVQAGGRQFIQMFKK